MHTPVPDELKCDHLFLLVGTNPLPNFVVARLLLRPETELHLIVTDEIQQLGIPKRLLEVLGVNSPENLRRFIHVSASDPEMVFQKVSARVKETRGKCNLHYTCGKKVMATHAYRAMETTLAEAKRSEDGFYSYLDADTLELIVESCQGTRPFRIHPDVKVQIEEILKLHGRHPYGSLKTIPYHEDLSQQLVAYYQDPENRMAWLDWAKNNLKGKDPKGEEKPLNKTQARAISIPTGVPVIGSKTIREIEQDWDSDPQKKDASGIARWLHGQWLDDYVFGQALYAAQNTNVHQVVSSINIEGLVTFEVDVVAMQGYRLLAISVTTDDEKGLAKLKLFEAIERARQMGGDEARVALVTFSEKPEKLKKLVGDVLHFTENDVEKPDWKSPVRVFGIYDLPNLAIGLEQWFKEV